MNPVLRRSAAHVVVDALEAPELREGDLHHLHVLRVRSGDELTLTDGTGRWASARLDGGAVRLVGDIQEADPPPRPADRALTIGVALPKGDRPEWIVQKLTEIGIDRIVLFETSRSVVRWDARKRAAHLERLQRIAREAVMQSRRVTLPTLSVVTWEDALSLPDVALAEPGGDPDGWGVSRHGDAAPVRSVLVGPEGGFTDDELARCPRRVSITATVLRVETAALAAGVLLVSRVCSR